MRWIDVEVYERNGIPIAVVEDMITAREFHVYEHVVGDRAIYRLWGDERSTPEGCKRVAKEMLLEHRLATA